MTALLLNPGTPVNPMVLGALQPLSLSTLFIFLCNDPSIFLPLPFMSISRLLSVVGTFVFLTPFFPDSGPSHSKAHQHNCSESNVALDNVGQFSGRSLTQVGLISSFVLERAQALREAVSRWF